MLSSVRGSEVCNEEHRGKKLLLTSKYILVPGGLKGKQISSQQI